MKMASRFLFVCVGIAVLFTGFVWAQNTAARLAGTWSGRATKQGARPYKVTVILDGSGAGFIEYSDMKCGGTLRFVRQVGDTRTYRETITHGKTSCGQEGRVDVVPSGNVLTWSWLAGASKATATLTKTPASLATGCVQCDFYHDRDIQACYRMTNSGDQLKCEDEAEEDAISCKAACRN